MWEKELISTTEQIILDPLRRVELSRPPQLRSRQYSIRPLTNLHGVDYRDQIIVSRKGPPHQEQPLGLSLVLEPARRELARL